MMVSWARFSGSAACCNLSKLALGPQIIQIHTLLLLRLPGAVAAIVGPKVSLLIARGEGM